MGKPTKFNRIRQNPTKIDKIQPNTPRTNRIQQNPKSKIIFLRIFAFLFHTELI